MLKKIILVLFLSASLFSSTITIAVSANVSYAIKALVKEFNKLYPDVKVRVILGGSGKLVAQIRNDAPYGLFMSANMDYPEALYKDGIALQKPLVYTQGSLAYLSRKKLDFSHISKLLKSDRIRKIAVANPKTAPYGRATIEALKNMGIYEDIKQKFVYSESISQTVSYAMMATDIGFVAKSSLYSSKMLRFKRDENWVEVDSILYTPIKQGVVILRQDKNIKLFYDFILSTEAKEIFKDFGYLI